MERLDLIYRMSNFEMVKALIPNAVQVLDPRQLAIGDDPSSRKQSHEINVNMPVNIFTSII